MKRASKSRGEATAPIATQSVPGRFTEALSERTSTATGYPVRDSTVAMLRVTIRSPGMFATERPSVRVILEQDDGPNTDEEAFDAYTEDLELLVRVLEHAIREARASGTIAPLAAVHDTP